MAVIAPFRGLLYAPDKVEDFSRIVAPPYDAITPRQQDELYQRHPCNVVRLILGKETERDNDNDNRYTRAAADYDRWRQEGLLQLDPAPAFYPYEQVFGLEDGSVVRRLGFLALIRLEDFASGTILPHERTLSGPKVDRMRLMEACRANFCPIFGLYTEPEGVIQGELEAATREPAVKAFTDSDGVVHRLWRLTRPEAIEQVRRAMADRVLYIADGHHRYETALAYRDARRAQGEDDPEAPYNYILMFIASMDAPGIAILPFHRLMSGLADFQPEQLLAELGSSYRLEEWPTPDRRAALPDFLAALHARGEGAHAFGLGLPRDDRFFLFSVDRNTPIPGNLNPAVQQLDVTVLHELVLRGLLRVRTESLKQQRHVTYIPSARKTLEALDQEPAQVAFWLNPTSIGEVRAVAQARAVMPQKSTYFYPKPITGLVINPLDEDEGFVSRAAGHRKGTPTT